MKLGWLQVTVQACGTLSGQSFHPYTCRTQPRCVMAISIGLCSVSSKQIGLHCRKEAEFGSLPAKSAHSIQIACKEELTA